MNLLNEFLDSHSTPPQDLAKRILFAIFDDLTDRRGIRHEWDNCDKEIQNEILEENLARIKKELGQT
jgi:hypothetical protein